MHSLSSPIAYPSSSSPPHITASHIINKKRGVSELEQNISSRKRILSSREGFEPPALTPLGHSLLSLKPVEANKENIWGRKLPSQHLFEIGNHPSSLTEGPKKCRSPEQPTPDHVSSTCEDDSSLCHRLGSKDASIEGLLRAKTSHGDIFPIRLKQKALRALVGEQSHLKSGLGSGDYNPRFYGIDIQRFLEDDKTFPEAGDDKTPNKQRDRVQSTILRPKSGRPCSRDCTMLWTEKYRARKFTDLVGDDRTHREVLRWLKGWDSIVFPTASKVKPKRKLQNDESKSDNQKKILLLTGSPGLGKTTLAHVCARQAGYEVLEINASDERSREIVKGKIRDCVGTENVKFVNSRNPDGKIRKRGRPFCVIVDEVDGAASGGSGGENGFIKALIELVMQDQKTYNIASNPTNDSVKVKKRGQNFRLLRPIILICNDVYHPSLRPLRATSVAEIIHVRKPPLEKIATRLGFVFEQEGISHDKDGVRRLCEATWGLQYQKGRFSGAASSCEGDIRSVLVAAEWIASKLRQVKEDRPRLSKQWIEDNVLQNLSHGGGGSRGVGRSGAREVVERVFQDSAGFTSSELLLTAQANLSDQGASHAQGVQETVKRKAMQRLREVIDASGESDQIISDCFAAYPSHTFQDDTFLTKPNAAYDWLYFHDRVSLRVHSGQQWDLQGYLSQSTLGLHHLFASPAKQFGGRDSMQHKEEVEKMPRFAGPRPDFEFQEATKENKATILALHSSLRTDLLRVVGSVADMTTVLLPCILKMLTPDVKPVLVGGSSDQDGIVSVRKDGEKRLIQRAVNLMSAIGVSFNRCRVDGGQTGVSSHIYRMEPSLDTLAVYETACQAGVLAPTRYAIRQALDQEYQKLRVRQRNELRQARFKAGNTTPTNGADEGSFLNDADQNCRIAEEPAKESRSEAPKRDFFGRIVGGSPSLSSGDGGKSDMPDHLPSKLKPVADDRKIWISFHEGSSNAVRKPITLLELLRDFR